MPDKPADKRSPICKGKRPRAAVAVSQVAPASALPAVAQDPVHQQRLLNIFADAFGGLISSETFPALLQDIKRALFGRDFTAAFTDERHLEAYAARWSPTRALCYAAVLAGIGGYLDRLFDSDDSDVPAVESPGDSYHAQPSSRKVRMLSIGGCAAEHVALASYLRHTSSHGAVVLLDSAPWSGVTSLLQKQLVIIPTLSKYASSSAKASNAPFLRDTQLSVNFCQQDALSLSKGRLTELAGTYPLLVTLLFTLNELYTNGGLGQTTRLLRLLGDVLPQGSLLLVIDSSGSYSEVTVGTEKKDIHCNGY